MAHRSAVCIRLSSIRRHKLAQLSEAQGHRCAYCCGETFLLQPGEKIPEGMNKFQQATLEHLIPQSEPVQTNKDENLVMACSNCNRLRSNYDYMNYFKSIRRVRIDPPKKKPKKLTPERMAKLEAKAGRTLAYCLICFAFWPEEAAYWAKHIKPRLSKAMFTRSRDYQISLLSKIVTADPRRLAC